MKLFGLNKRRNEKLDYKKLFYTFQIEIMTCVIL